MTKKEIKKRINYLKSELAHEHLLVIDDIGAENSTDLAS